MSTSSLFINLEKSNVDLAVWTSRCPARLCSFLEDLGVLFWGGALLACGPSRFSTRGGARPHGSCTSCDPPDSLSAF